MRTLQRICAVVLLTVACSTFALADGSDGWIGSGHKPPQPTTVLMADSSVAPELIIAETGEESSYFDELYEATLIFLQMGLL